MTVSNPRTPSGPPDVASPIPAFTKKTGLESSTEEKQAAQKSFVGRALSMATLPAESVVAYVSTRGT